MIKQIDYWIPSLSLCEDTLRKLIQINTCQPDGNEELIVDHIISELPDHIDYQKLVHSDHRASLVVTLPGRSSTGGTAFLGHLDTVACPDPDTWSFPTHEAVVKDGIMYGRGTSDMKGGVTSMILAMREMINRDVKPEKPVYFCFTADEEKDGTGALSIVEQKILKDVDQVIICEPSDEKIGFCEKGALWLRVHVKGVYCHGSRPELGANAIDAAVSFLSGLKKSVEDERRHAILGRSTVSVTKISGGIMTNIIPGEARMDIDIRTIPDTDHDAIVDTAERIAKEVETKQPRISMTVSVLNNRRSLETDPQSLMVQEVYRIAEQVGISTEPKGHHFYTDASQVIPSIHVPFVIAGPGDDAKAHCTDECVSIESVARFASLYFRYAAKTNEENAD